MSRLTYQEDESFCSLSSCEGRDKCRINCYENKIYKKLREYEYLEEQGLLLKTPISEETEIWTNAPFKDRVIRKGNVEVLIFSENRLFSFGCSFDGIPLSAEFLAKDLGEKVFLTKAEAEEKLKSMRVE